MEKNSGEDDNDLSATANHSFSGDGGGNGGSEESGWTSYIDYFMETQHRQRKKEEVSRVGDPSTGDDAGRRCSCTSEYSSSDAGVVGASTRLPELAEPSTVSRCLSLKEGWRRKKALYDESLEDTATSPISSPKLIELFRDSDATHHQKKQNPCDEISRSKRKSTGSDVNNGANTTIDTAIKEDSSYDNNELMKKKAGLCLVPVSAFHV